MSAMLHTHNNTRFGLASESICKRYFQFIVVGLALSIESGKAARRAAWI